MAGRDEMMMRQRALADFGDFVLDHEGLDEILNEGCRLVAVGLGADLAKVIEIERETETGLVRAGVGWRPGVVGRERVSLTERSSEAFAIEQAEPVITNDILREDRFEFPPFLRDHGVIALVNVPILLPGRRPWGILQVDAREPREFDQDDIEFLKTYAMVLGPVIDRLQVAAEREQARRGLAEREDRLRGILEGMGEGFDLLAPDFTVLEHNPEARRLDGRDRDQVVGRSHWHLFPGTEHSELGRLLKKAMADRVPVALEHRYVWEEGRARWLDMRAYPTPDGALAVFWRDVTDRRQAVDALRESEERYRTLFELMDEAYAVVEVLKNDDGAWADFRFIEVNRAFIEHTTMPWPVGKTATELLGTPNPRWTQLYGQVLDTGQPLRVEEEEPTLGRIFDLNIFALDRPKNRVAVLFANITERKKVEAALRESEERQAFLLMLSDRLRAEVDARAIAATSLDLLADHLRLDRAYVAQVDKGRDLAEIGPEHRRADLGPVEGVLALSEFPAAFAQVERTTLVLADTTADSTLSDLDRQGFAKLRMGALIVAAARKGARNPVWSLLVAMEEPRVWTAAEVALVEEVAERTWAAIERNRAVERQKLLLAELQHRVRNILAMVRSVVRRTVRSGDSAEDIADHLDGRLSSLARTQVMLTRAAAAGVDLEDLIREELLAQQADESAISVSGPAIELAPKAAEVLTLAIHELATNAIKYGALAHAGASLEVRWWVEADDDGRDRLRLLWQERGARVISAQPRRSGFGTELVQKRVPYELKGRGEIEFRPGGIRVEISFPLVHGESILATGLPRSFSREGDDA